MKSSKNAISLITAVGIGGSAIGTAYLGKELVGTILRTADRVPFLKLHQEHEERDGQGRWLEAQRSSRTTSGDLACVMRATIPGHWPCVVKFQVPDTACKGQILVNLAHWEEIQQFRSL